MGEHHSNPIAKANAVPQRSVPVMDVGDGYGVIGISLEPAIRVDPETGDKNFCAVVYLVGGKKSDLVPMIPVKIPMGELTSVPVSKLREMIESASKPKVEQ